jgi:hypothetical protein
MNQTRSALFTNKMMKVALSPKMSLIKMCTLILQNMVLLDNSNNYYVILQYSRKMMKTMKKMTILMLKLI